MALLTLVHLPGNGIASNVMYYFCCLVTELLNCISVFIWLIPLTNALDERRWKGHVASLINSISL